MDNRTEPSRDRLVRVASGGTDMRVNSTKLRADHDASVIFRTIAAATSAARRKRPYPKPGSVRKTRIGQMRGGRVMYDAEVLDLVLRSLRQMKMWTCLHNLGNFEYDLYLVERF